MCLLSVQSDFERAEWIRDDGKMVKYLSTRDSSLLESREKTA